jgi:dihydrofolate reductase
MAQLHVFNFLTLNGFYKGPGEDISWHQHGEEEGEFAAEGAGSGGMIVFGRVTYEMMASFWPTPQAMKEMPEVAEGMNKSEKIVFSRTLKKAEWSNTRIIRDNIIDEMKKLKQQSTKDMTILGSGSIVTQFAEHGLIDEYMLMVDPIALGEGTPLFKGIKHNLNLKLVDTRVFKKSGVVLLRYSSQK